MGRPRKRPYRNDYADDDYYRRRPSALLRFFIAVIWILGIVITICLILLILLNLALSIQILFYALWVGGGLAVLGVLYLAVRLISAMSRLLSAARREKAAAKQEKMKALQEQERIQEIRAKRERDQQIFYQQQQARQIEERARSRPFRTLKLPEYGGEPPAEAFYDQLTQKTRPGPRSQRKTQPFPLEEEEHHSLSSQGIPGMPAPGHIFYYADYRRYAKPGQLIIGIRRDGTARIGTWQDYKILLILGSSSSGKTTTMTEKCLGAARGGGQLVLCDPHGFKPDSLLRRLYPLKEALMPGTVFALKHADIMHNVTMVRQELERRVAGASCDIPVFLVIEELNRLQRDKAVASELKEILQIIGQEGRGFNVYCLIGAQQITHLAEIRKSIISFICHKVDESESRLCIPARFAKYSGELRVGQTFVKDADGVTEPLQQVLVTVEDVQQAALALSKRQLPPAAEQTLREEEPLPLPPPASRSVQRTGMDDHPPTAVPAQPRRTEYSLERQPQQAPVSWDENDLLSPDEARLRPSRPFRDTEDLGRHQPPPSANPIPSSPTDPIQQSQTALARQKLDALAQQRSQKKKHS